MCHAHCYIVCHWSSGSIRQVYETVRSRLCCNNNPKFSVVKNKVSHNIWPPWLSDPALYRCTRSGWVDLYLRCCWYHGIEHRNKLNYWLGVRHSMVIDVIFCCYFIEQSHQMAIPAFINVVILNHSPGWGTPQEKAAQKGISRSFDQAVIYCFMC